MTRIIWTLVVTLFVVTAALAQDKPSTASDDCMASHKADLKVRVSPGIMRVFLQKAGKYEDPTLKHDATRVKGDVSFRVLIDPTGNIDCADVLATDSPMLNSGALEVTKRTTFKPYMLNRKPVFVETTLKVHEAKGKFELAW